jgi:GNAT superfamily N-acetyltransferase
MSSAASLRVRPAGMDDYDAVCLLFDELDDIHRRARPDMFQPFPLPVRTREQLGRWLAEPDSTLLVAENGEGTVGLALLVTRPASPFAGAVPRRVVEIENIVVRADQRSRLIGRKLLAASVDWARRRAATHVEVAVHDFNQRAERFYGAFGFARSVNRLMLAA